MCTPIYSGSQSQCTNEFSPLAPRFVINKSSMFESTEIFQCFSTKGRRSAYTPRLFTRLRTPGRHRRGCSSLPCIYVYIVAVSKAACCENGWIQNVFRFEIDFHVARRQAIIVVRGFTILFLGASSPFFLLFIFLPPSFIPRILDDP